jgi:hypothetical protein
MDCIALDTHTAFFACAGVDHPVDRWKTGVPTDERSKTPLKIGICIDVFYPVDRWTDCEGVAVRLLTPDF